MLSRALRVNVSRYVHICVALPSTSQPCATQRRTKATVATTSDVLSKLNLDAAALGPIPPAPSPLDTAQLAEIAARTAAEGLREAGVDNYTPIGFVQWSIDLLHETGLPWWAAIISVTSLIRLCMFPLTVSITKFQIRAHNTQPQMLRLMSRLEKAKATGDKFELTAAQADLMHFYQKHNTNPIKLVSRMPLQMIPFVCNFMALKRMANAPVPGFENGGLLWFPNLSMPDATWGLPIISAATVLTTYELARRNTVVQVPPMFAKWDWAMPWAIRIGIPVVIVGWSSYFPAALCLHWCMSNVIGLIISQGILQIPAVKHALDIPERQAHPTWYADAKKRYDAARVQYAKQSNDNPYASMKKAQADFNDPASKKTSSSAVSQRLQPIEQQTKKIKKVW